MGNKKKMSLQTMDSFLYVPPLLVAALVGFYRNSILCFWSCNPAVLTAKEAYHQVMVRATQLYLLLQQFPSDVMLLIKSFLALMINNLYNTVIQLEWLKSYAFKTLKVVVLNLQQLVQSISNSFVKPQLPNGFLLGGACLIVLLILGITYAITKKDVPVVEMPGKRRSLRLQAKMKQV